MSVTAVYKLYRKASFTFPPQGLCHSSFTTFFFLLFCKPKMYPPVTCNYILAYHRDSFNFCITKGPNDSCSSYLAYFFASWYHKVKFSICIACTFLQCWTRVSQHFLIFNQIWGYKQLIILMDPSIREFLDKIVSVTLNSLTNGLNRNTELRANDFILY